MPDMQIADESNGKMIAKRTAVEELQNTKKEN